MKNSILIFFAVFSLGLLTFSCEKEKVTSQEEGADYFFTCKMDGKDYTIKGNTLAYGVKWDDSYSVYGVSNLNGDNVIYLNLKKELGIGTHQMTDSNNYGLVSLQDGTSWSTYWGAGTGSVTITEKTESVVKGTFSFTAYNADDESEKMTVTDGSFRVVFRD